MAREVVRRICGHAEAIYAVGPPGRVVRKIERSSGDICRICRDLPPSISASVVDSKNDDSRSGNESVREILKRRRERS